MSLLIKTRNKIVWLKQGSIFFEVKANVKGKNYSLHNSKFVERRD